MSTPHLSLSSFLNGTTRVYDDTVRNENENSQFNSKLFLLLLLVWQFGAHL